MALAAFRSVFAYSNALARYDLTAAQFRARKLVASGAAAQRMVAREGASQRERRAEMVLAWLKRRPTATLDVLETDRAEMVREWTGDQVPIDVDVASAAGDLQRLRLVTTAEGGRVATVAAPPPPPSPRPPPPPVPPPQQQVPALPKALPLKALPEGWQAVLHWSGRVYYTS